MANERTVRLAQIGLGAWSYCIGNAIMKSNKVELVTCFEPAREKRKAFSEKYQCDSEERYEDVLNREDVDGVFLTTPNAIHAEQAVLAAKYGKHVFVEKPIANTLSDGRRIVTACEENKVVLMVGHQQRRFAGFRKLKELIDKGAIGNPIQVEANFSHNIGFVLTPEMFRWRGDDSGCPGGALMTLGVHHAETLHHLFGPVKIVFSYFNKLYIQAPVADVTTTIFQFESGVQGYLGSNYASPKALWMYVYGTEANLLCTVILPEVHYEEYLLRVPFVDRDTRVQIFEKGKTGSKDIPLSEGDPVQEEIDEFAHCVQTGARPETDGQGALVALALIRAAIASALSGKPERIET